MTSNHVVSTPPHATSPPPPTPEPPTPRGTLRIWIFTSYAMLSRMNMLTRSFHPRVATNLRHLSIKGNNPNAKNILGIYNVSPELSALLGKSQVTRQDALKVSQRLSNE